MSLFVLAKKEERYSARKKPRTRN